VRALCFILALSALCASCVGGDAPGPRIPLGSGEYEFVHRFAEHPSIRSIRVDVRIDGSHIAVYNHESDSVFPLGLLEQGTLLWHAGAGRWIIGNSDEDSLAPEVGGCTDGPTTVDLVERIYWTC